MAVKAIQLIQIGTAMGSEEKARETIRLMKEAGYDGIELNGFMMKKMPPIVRVLTTLCGDADWKDSEIRLKKLIADTGLKVVSIHEDLGSILRNPQEIMEEAKTFSTKYIVITGMHRFDYSNMAAVLELAQKLNKAGKILKEGGILLYHNHNREFRKVGAGKCAYDVLIEKTNPEYVNFEFDSYWATEAGVDTIALMERLGERMKLYHINDRGTRDERTGRTDSQIGQYGTWIR